MLQSKLMTRQINNSVFFFTAQRLYVCIVIKCLKLYRSLKALFTMKKIILSLTLTLGFYSVNAQLFHEDFEVADSVISSGNPGWFSNNRLSVGGSFCDSASIQNAGDTSILSTLFLNCSGTSKVFLSFDHICKAPNSEVATIEVSTDGGLNFVPLTSANSYYAGNGSLGSGFTFSDVVYPEWLAGTPTAMPDNSWWKHETFNLNNLLANQANAVIRFNLYDGNYDGSNGSSGWFIDNLKVDTIAPPDAGVIVVPGFGITSVAGNSMPVDPVVRNFGADTLYTFNVGYTLNGGSPVTQPWTGTLAPGDTVTVSLPPVIIPSGPVDICAFTDVTGDADISNDTLCISGFGAPIVNVPYFDDFEGANYGWIDPSPLGTATIWELGLPNYGQTNSTHSGVRSWDINLDTSYFGPCNSILYSPYFDFSSVGNASLSFWQNMNTEAQIDGMRLEYTTNGINWNTLGTANNPLNASWYTDPAINSTQQPGWEGNSAGWVQSTYPLPSNLSFQSNVQFRFVFSADNAVDIDGVSLDDFSIIPSSCGNTISSIAVPTTCGDSLLFSYTSTAGIDSFYWDLGDGTTSTQPGITNYYTAGNYQVMLYTIDSNGCAASSIANISVTNGFSADAGPDVVSCGGATQLNVTLTKPGAYTYSWSPIAGLNNPFIPNPQANHVDSLSYIVTVTDTITGCVSSDEVVVSAYSGLSGIITICQGGATIFDLGPGAFSYLWQNFTDTLGNIFPINVSSQTYLASQPGTYTATATFPLCGVINSSVQLVADTNCITSVWPGDCNYDQTANNKDLLNIGLAYNITGPLRPGATTNWVAQPVPDWNYYFAAGINYKHSDCNGDSIVDSLDVPAILLNYGLNHPLKPASSVSFEKVNTPALFLTANVDTAGISDTIQLTLNLGTAAIPVDSIYGIAFTITYDPTLVDTTISPSYDFSSSWIGVPVIDALTLEKHFTSQGRSDGGFVRFDHNNIYNGSGPMGLMTIVTTDDLSGLAVIKFDFSNVFAVTHSEYLIPLTVLGDSVVLDPNWNGIDTPDADMISVYPNPASTDLIVRSKYHGVISIELNNLLGQTIRNIPMEGNMIRIDVSDLSEGIFFLSVLTDKGVISKKVQVIK